MVTPEIRRLQVLNDLIAQTLDVINQRSLWSSGLSHTPYAPEPGVQQMNPFLAPYGVPQTNISQLTGAQVPFAAQGLMHSPFAGLPGPFGQQPFGQFYQGIPFGSPWTQGLMHTPFTGYPVQRGIEAGIGFGQPGVSFGQQPLGPIAPQGQQAVPFPWSTIGYGAGRFGQYF